MWAKILQGKEEEMDIDTLVARNATLEARVKILEQRLAGQDERIREAVREMTNKVIQTSVQVTEDIHTLRMNVPSLLMFLDLKKQVETLQERLGE